MSNRFDWHTEDGFPSNPSPRMDEPKGGGAGMRRAALFALVILGAIGAFLALSRRQIDQASATAEQEALATHELITDAIEQLDSDLMSSFLSGRDPTWASVMKELVGDGELRGLGALGLVLEASRPIVVDIELSPELTSAEVTAAWSYSPLAATEPGQTISLLVPSVYRRGSDRWLYAPPDETFWGKEATFSEGLLVLTFPSRDEAIASELGRAIVSLMDRICREVDDQSCSTLSRLRIRLDTAPASLHFLHDPAHTLTLGEELVLPTPSLVGLPADERAADALLNGYLTLATETVITQLAGWSCCERGLLFRELLDRQLASLELRSWHLSSEDYEQMLSQLPMPRDPEALWLEEDLELDASVHRGFAMAVIDFMFERNPTASPIAMQRRLQEVRIFNEWLDAFVPESNAENDIFRDWLRTANAKSLSGRLAQRIPGPQQDLQVTCRSGDGEQGNRIYRYNPTTKEWVLEANLDRSAFVFPKPDDDGVLALRIDQSEDNVWDLRRGRTALAYEGSIESNPWLKPMGLIDPMGEYLAMLDVTGRQPPGGQGRINILQVEECSWPGCHLYPIAGLPYWSPDGANTLLIEPDALLGLDSGTNRIWRGDRLGQGGILVGEGSMPFWIINGVYGFLRGGSEIIAASTNDDEPRVILTLTQLRESLAEAGFTEPIRIWALTSLQSGSSTLAISASTLARRQQTVFYFLYDLSSDEPSLLLALENVGASTPQFSPNGRWMVARTFERRGVESSEPLSLYLYDLDLRRVARVMPTLRTSSERIDWSNDGKWLLKGNDGFLELLAPEIDVGFGHFYHEVIVHKEVDCSDAVWINR